MIEDVKIKQKNEISDEIFEKLTHNGSMSIEFFQEIKGGNLDAELYLKLLSKQVAKRLIIRYAILVCIFTVVVLSSMGINLFGIITVGIMVILSYIMCVKKLKKIYTPKEAYRMLVELSNLK